MPSAPFSHDGGLGAPEEAFENSKPVVPQALRHGSGGLSAPATGPAGTAAPGGEAGTTRAQQDASVTTPSEFAIKGKRTDLPEGYGFRYRVGFDGAGNLVVEKWSEAGVKTTAAFS